MHDFHPEAPVGLTATNVAQDVWSLARKVPDSIRKLSTCLPMPHTCSLQHAAAQAPANVTAALALSRFTSLRKPGYVRE